MRENVETQLQGLVQIKENFKGTYQRLKFLNKFFLYSGLSKHVEQMSPKTIDIFSKPLDQYENEVMKIFNCDPEWPICLFDFTYKNKIPSYLSFRASSSAPVIVENYFYSGHKHEHID